jgi:hypothetical protein
VKSGGAKIKIPSGKALCIEWPISLNGEFKKIGAGTLVLASEMTFGENGGFIVSEGCVSVSAGMTNAIDGISFAGGGFAVSYDSESGACGVLEVGEMPSGMIKVRPPAERGIKIPFMKIPVSVGEIASSDFTAVADLASSGLPSFKVTVEQEGDYQVAYLETAKTITVADGASAVYALLNGEGWSDGELMHSCGDYLVDAKTAARKLTFGVGDLASLDNDVLNYEMPDGSSLTFTGKHQGSTAEWLVRQKVFKGDVRAVGDNILFKPCGNTVVATASSYENSVGDVHTLRGRLYVSNSSLSDTGIKIETGCGRVVKIESTVSGAGTICLRSKSGVENKLCTYILSGTNDFCGRWFLYNSYHDEPWVTNTFRFADERNLGRGVKGKNSEVFMQGGRVVIHPIGSVSVDIPYRPLYFFSGHCIVKVDEGEVFKWNSPITFRNGSASKQTIAYKLGRGIFAIGGNVTLEKSSSKWGYPFNVDEGYIRADNARAFSGMTVTFAEGAGIAAKYDPEATGESAQYGMIVTDPALFTVAGWKLAVKVETGGDLMLNKSVPVLTVPASMADGVEGKLSGTCDLPKGGVVFVRENVELDDAQYVRFSAEIRRGTVVVVR